MSLSLPVRALSSLGSGNLTYSRPDGPSVAPSPVAPPVVPFPLLPPPPSTPPRLPSRPGVPPIPGFSRSQHVVPAAYPRQFRESHGVLSRSSTPFRASQPPSRSTSGASGQTLPDAISSNAQGKEERKRQALDDATTSVLTRAKADRWTLKTALEERPEPLWIAAERWRREDQRGGGESITLVLAHANGFPKEHWHPTLRHLLSLVPVSVPYGSSLSSTTPCDDSRWRIDDIWLLDDIHHSASVDLNEGRIGPVHGWTDGGRDIANVIEHVIPSSKEVVRTEELKWREGRGVETVVGAGHSFGGNAMVQAAHGRPDLFKAVFLIEPMCVPLYLNPKVPMDQQFPKIVPLVFGAIKRRHIWPSIEEAASVRSSPFFANWHPEVWDRWLSHALVPNDSVDPGTTTGSVQLATPPWCEAAVFSEASGLAEGWDKLPQLDLPVGFLMASDPTTTHGPAVTRELVWRPKNARNEVVPDSQHLLVQENPEAVAGAIQRFVSNLEGKHVARL